MRILGINFQDAQEPSCAEAFLKFSPRVQFRYPCFVFCDIESTACLFDGEHSLLIQALSLAKEMGSQAATAAISDSAYCTQVLTITKPLTISKPGQDLETLRTLPLTVLTDLEGLRPWSQKRSVENVISFFHSTGFHKIEEVLHLKLSSFRERWGDIGVQLWNRLHQKEVQVISPLSTRDPLVGYAYFDDPVSWTSTLRQKLDPVVHTLFLRLEGLNRFAQRLNLTLFCEYSNKQHFISVEPVVASRDEKLFIDLLLHKLDETDLENPVRDFEVEIYDVPEKIQQLDFFEPRDSTEDCWRRLISFAHQAECEMGFLQIEASHFPEKSYRLKSDWPEEFKPKDIVEMSGSAIQVKSVYAKELEKSPRPSLLLKVPLPMSSTMLSKLQMVSRIPVERIESSWWDRSKEEHKIRDYYFALSQEGQLLWLYQDRASKYYYLHGYFD
jgi:protein ImuB